MLPLRPLYSPVYVKVAKIWTRTQEEPLTILALAAVLCIPVLVGRAVASGNRIAHFAGSILGPRSRAIGSLALAALGRARVCALKSLEGSTTYKRGEC